VSTSTAQTPCRARDLGIVVGALPTGEHNAITDVPGVRVGQVTIDDGGDVHTGVTAIVPAQLAAERPALPCAIVTGNGFGKLVGSTQVDELGVLETPVLLTATLSVFRAADALLTHMMSLPGYRNARSINPVVGETNDGYLSDIRARPITERHVLDALAGASAGPVAEGCVGAGTGTAALGYKAGIGTSSRVVIAGGGRSVTVGVLVQANFSGTLQVLGVPLPAEELLAGAKHGEGDPEGTAGDPGGTAGEPASTPEEPDGNSCMIVVATDAAVDARQLGRIGRRAVFAMGRIGSDFASGSGDYAIAFGCADAGTEALQEREIDALFRATTDATEEALLNSLFAAVDTVGIGGHRRFAVPHQAALRRLRAAGRLGPG
jgi:D-aminopeptidase